MLALMMSMMRRSG